MPKYLVTETWISDQGYKSVKHHEVEGPTPDDAVKTLDFPAMLDAFENGDITDEDIEESHCDTGTGTSIFFTVYADDGHWDMAVVPRPAQPAYDQAFRDAAKLLENVEGHREWMHDKQVAAQTSEGMDLQFNRSMGSIRLSNQTKGVKRVWLHVNLDVCVDDREAMEIRDDVTGEEIAAIITKYHNLVHEIKADLRGICKS